MKKIHCFFLSVLLCILFFIGCTEESKTITITIESFSPYDAPGYVTVDGIHIRNFTFSLFNKTSLTVQKSQLPTNTLHNASLVIYSFENTSQTVTASCTEATTFVSFVISVQHEIAIRRCE